MVKREQHQTKSMTKQKRILSIQIRTKCAQAFVLNVMLHSFKCTVCTCTCILYTHTHSHIYTYTVVKRVQLKSCIRRWFHETPISTITYIHEGDFEASTCREYWSQKTRKFVYLLWLVRYSSFDGLNVSWQDSANERCCLDIERKLKNGKNTSTIYIISNALIYVYIRTWFSIDGSAP